MQVWFCLIAIAAGALNPVQAACNGELGRHLGRPFMVVLISVSCSLVVAIIVGFASGGLGWSAEKAAGVPWWAWCGGTFGVILVLSQPLAALRLGAPLFIGLTVTSAITASVLLDHFGALGYPQHTANAARLLGCAFMALGVALVARY